jgi:hypothetical protein
MATSDPVPMPPDPPEPEPEPEPVPSLPAVVRVMSVGFRPAAGGAQSDRSVGPVGRDVGQLLMFVLTRSAVCPLSAAFPFRGRAALPPKRS